MVLQMLLLLLLMLLLLRYLLYVTWRQPFCATTAPIQSVRKSGSQSVRQAVRPSVRSSNCPQMSESE
uniref:Secreted protein n=1 Tax=Physcomitrium patens TaxID=3218 RepID=A0A2K1JW10_PHYPA|nr:hypothetical protein PHYPA_015493 [Physcomitrium patens]